MTEEYLTYGHRLEQHIADTHALAAPMLDDEQARDLRGRAGRAARHRPRHLSVRDLVEPGRGRGLRRRRRRADATSPRSGASRRRTRRASAPARSRPSSTTSSASSCASAAASSARRPAAPRRTGWLDLVALRYAARINSLTALVDHEARRAERLRDASRSARATAATTARASTTFPYHQSVLHHARRRVRGAAGLDRGHQRGAQRGATCPQAARDYLALHRGAHRRAGRADRRRPGPRADRSWTGAGASRTGARRPRGVGGRVAPRRAQRQRSSRSSSGTSRTTRAGTPITTARGGNVAR